VITAHSLLLRRAGSRLRRRSPGGLILDLDDTLYPRERFVLGGLAAVASHVASRYAVSADAAFATMLRVWAGPDRGHELQALCAAHAIPGGAIPELIAVFRDHQPALRLEPGVIAALQDLRRAGWQTAVLTNGLPSVQAGKVAALDLAQYVDHVLYAETCAPGGKPAAAAFTAALRRLELPAESCICVGDDPVCDILGARRAGMRTVRVVRAGVTVVPAEEADALVDRFDDVPLAVASLQEMVALDVA
jgi:putative hydrolase of the HAD superfamily